MNREIRCLIVVIVAAAAVPAATHGQAIYAGHVRSDIVDAGSDFDARNGLAFGFSTPVIRRGAFALLLELFYVQKGAQPRAMGPDGIDDLRVDYFEAQMLGRIRSPVRAGPVTPWAVGGAVFSWQGKCSFGFADGDDRSSSCPFAGLVQTGLESPLDDYDWSWAYGGGVDFPVPYVGTMTLGVRFTRSIGKVIIGTTDTSPRHTTRMITLGLSLPS